MSRIRNQASKKKPAERILEAAEGLLWEKGVEGISARDIADRAGVNKALVFYYWGSMAGVFEKVVERYYNRQREALAEAFQIEGSLGERVHRMLDAYIDFIEDNQIYPRLVQQQALSGGTLLQMVQRHLATLFDWVTRVIGEVAPEPGHLSSKHFYITLTGIVTSYYIYAPLLGERWGGNPLGAEGLVERRAHIHWLVDAMLARLQEGELSR